MRADKRAVKQILLNLLSNAVKFTPSKGRVTIRLSKAKEHAKITITDTGIGIPESELGKLGRPFEQVENQLTKSHRGSGLGFGDLALVGRDAWRQVRDREQRNGRDGGCLPSCRSSRPYHRPSADAA